MPASGGPSLTLSSNTQLLVGAEQRLLSPEELGYLQKEIREAQKVSINGKHFTIKEIPSDTPLFYPFFCKDQYTQIPDEYIRIFKNNCRVEGQRPAVILTLSNMLNQPVQKQLAELKQEFDNVHIVELSSLLNENGHISGIIITQQQNNQGNTLLKINGTQYLNPQSLTDGIARTYNQLCDIMDILSLLAMVHCDKVCQKAGIQNSSTGCIKIDWDMEFTAPIGTIKCPDGFSPFVIDKLSHWGDKDGNILRHHLQPEMGLMAVNRPKHPAITKALRPNFRIYKGYTEAITKFYQADKPPSHDFESQMVSIAPEESETIKALFHFRTREETFQKINIGKSVSIHFPNAFSWWQKIAFPLTHTKADQSHIMGVSSWQAKSSNT